MPLQLTDEDRAAIVAALNAERGTLDPFTLDDLSWMNETAYLAGMRAMAERAAKACIDCQPMMYGAVPAQRKTGYDQACENCAAAIRAIIA